MKVEINTLEYINAWEIVDIDNPMKFIDLTWNLKCKIYPDGLINKFKARFCARGNQKLERIYFFETYELVVQWTTVLLVLILELLLCLKSKQGDVNDEFLNADIHKDEKFYVETPRGFEQLSNNGRKNV